jgi:hypothetical protein
MELRLQAKTAKSPPHRLPHRYVSALVYRRGRRLGEATAAEKQQLSLAARKQRVSEQSRRFRNQRIGEIKNPIALG